MTRRELLPRHEQLLQQNEFVFSPQVLSKIRAVFNRKHVVVVDAHGVIFSQNEKQLNPDAIVALQAIKDAGYALVLWSRSGNEIRESISKIAVVFDLIITEENYKRSSSKPLLSILSKSKQQIFVDAIDQTPWFSQEEKLRFKTVNVTEKTPQILFPHCAWIQDFHHNLEYYSRHLDREHLDNYHLFMVHEFGSEDKDQYPIFSKQVVDVVKKIYPPM